MYSPLLVMREPLASKSQFDKLNKELRRKFYCVRHEKGFLVYRSARKETN